MVSSFRVGSVRWHLVILGHVISQVGTVSIGNWHEVLGLTHSLYHKYHVVTILLRVFGNTDLLTRYDGYI